MSSEFMHRIAPVARRLEVTADEPVWTMVKDERRMVALTWTIHSLNALEVRYMLDGDLRFSRMYRGPELANVKADLDAKRAELEAKGWTLESAVNQD